MLTLITTPDGFELIRQQIAALLVLERDNQVRLAASAAKDPSLWRFSIYEERSTAYEAALTPDDDGEYDLTPIVNVWFSSDSFSESSSTRAGNQKCTGAYNIDIYGFAIAQETVTGFAPADMRAAKAAQRTARLVRNILMSSENTYLQMPRGTAWDRKIESRQSFQPDLSANPTVEVVGLRIRFLVSFNEYGPQYEGVPLSKLVIDLNRAETGELYLELEYNYPTP